MKCTGYKERKNKCNNKTEPYSNWCKKCEELVVKDIEIEIDKINNYKRNRNKKIKES